MSYTVTINQPDDLDEFRDVARRLLAAQVAPADISWNHGQIATLFANALPTNSKSLTIPRSFADLAGIVICHRDEQTWSLLYQALWRIDLGQRSLMQQLADPLVHKLHRIATAIRHDQHRMTAFVRFREVADAHGPLFIAWYQPQHRILRRASTFFIDRFSNMRFSILTPDLTLHWDQTEKRFAPGLRRQDAASADAVEDWWRRYYAAIFNPARINTRLMQSHMPKHFWRDLPEAATIMDLVNGAGARTNRMIRPLPAHIIP